MFSSGPNYNKLKTNLRLAISRLKLLEKKKTELNQKAKKEVADYLAAGKVERAKIRVEYCIREDYLVEGMEMTELYCDMILARFGIIEQSKELEAGLAESISSVIWVTPQLATEVAELKVICDQLTRKFGKPYAMACQSKEVSTISERLIHKMSVQAPPKIMVEKYLVEIANNYNIEYEPDPQVMSDSQCESLINLDEKNNLGNNSISAPVGGGQMNIPPAGFVGYPGHPMAPFAYPASQVPVPSQSLQEGQGFHNSSSLMPHPDQILQPVPVPVPAPQSPTTPKSLSPKMGGNLSLPSILVTNPQSLTNCFEEFAQTVENHKPEIIVVSETWFSETRPATNYALEGYKMFNDDREGRGGGVAVYVLDCLHPNEVKLDAPPELECVWVEVDRKLVICGLYHPPRAATGPLLMEQIVNSVLDIRSFRPDIAIAIAGDFNNLHQGRLCAGLEMTNLVQEPTHMNSVIDLVLTDHPECYKKPILLPPVGQSRHHCVLVLPKTATESDNVQMDPASAVFNLPSVPGQAPYPQAPYPGGATGYNIPPGGPQNFPPGGPQNFPPGGPPPPDPGADPLPPKINNMDDGDKPKPSPRSKFGEGVNAEFNLPDLPTIPDLPSVPGSNTVQNPNETTEDIDFDDLTKRFEELKKKK
ncbi:IST1 homolog isoform X2 [Penaeus chinensis]|uniref:IST1 homolog isoform X2 n=1 Tax=Penaeus chinensis TaxID=139456 RepID=UPI001FB8574D|nr:IST1 homolog isoform X2 [Penaeus chinensis]